jgi:hypothetical protein
MTAAGPQDSAALLPELCESLEHRGMGSANERKAAGWIMEKLRNMGYRIAQQPFRASLDNLYRMPRQVFARAAAAFCAGAVHAAHMGRARRVGLWARDSGRGGFGVSVQPQPVAGIPVAECRNGAPRRGGARCLSPRNYDTPRSSYLFHPQFLEDRYRSLIPRFANLPGTSVNGPRTRLGPRTSGWV